jgi:hypothetical protein
LGIVADWWAWFLFKVNLEMKDCDIKVKVKVISDYIFAISQACIIVQCDKINYHILICHSMVSKYFQTHYLILLITQPCEIDSKDMIITS